MKDNQDATNTTRHHSARGHDFKFCSRAKQPPRNRIERWCETAKPGTRLLFIFPILFGCGILEPDKTGVEVEAHSQNLYIINHTGAIVYYVVFPRDLLASVAWKPCVDPRCHSAILPQQEAVVSYAQLLGDMKDDEAVVYWWHLIAKGDQGYEVDELSMLVVKL